MAVFRVEKNSGYTVMSNHHLRNRAPAQAGADHPVYRSALCGVQPAGPCAFADLPRRDVRSGENPLQDVYKRQFQLAVNSSQALMMFQR